MEGQQKLTSTCLTRWNHSKQNVVFMIAFFVIAGAIWCCTLLLNNFILRKDALEPVNFWNDTNFKLFCFVKLESFCGFPKQERGIFLRKRSHVELVIFNCFRKNELSTIKYLKVVLFLEIDRYTMKRPRCQILSIHYM